MKNKKYFTIAEASKALKVGEPIIKYRISVGVIQTIQFGDMVLIPASSIYPAKK